MTAVNAKLIRKGFISKLLARVQELAPWGIDYCQICDLESFKEAVLEPKKRTRLVFDYECRLNFFMKS